MDPVLARLDDLERRVSLLEAERPAPQAPRPSLREALPAVLRRRRVPGPPPPLTPALEPAPAAGEAAPEASAPRRPERLGGAARGPRDLESWVGTVVLGRVGIAAVVLAAGYFAQLAYRHVGDGLKVLSLYGLSAALLGAGALLRRRAPARYVALLWGGGLAVAYVAGLAATLRYGLVPPGVGMLLLAGVGALGQALARRLGAESLATVSLLGALAAPVLLDVLVGHGAWVLVYAAVVHGWAVLAQARWGWRRTREATLVGATLLGSAWGLSRGLPQAPALFAALHGFLGTLLLPELLLAWRGSGPSRPRATFAIGATSTLALALVLAEAGGEPGLRGASALAGGALLLLGVALGGGRGPEAARLSRGLSTVGGLALVLGAGLAWPDAASPLPAVASLTLAAVVTLAAAPRTRAGDLPAAVAGTATLILAVAEALRLTRVPAPAAQPGLLVAGLLLALGPGALLALVGRAAAARVAGYALAALTAGLAFLAAGLRGADAWIAPALGAPAALSLAAQALGLRRGELGLARAAEAGLLALGVAWGLLCLELPHPAGWPALLDPHTLSALGVSAALVVGRRRSRGAADDLPALLGGMAVALPAAAGWREMQRVAAGVPGVWGPVLASAYLTLVSSLLLAWGLARGVRGARIAALCGFGLVVVKVGLFDLAALSLPLRVLLSGGLGLVLLASAYAYARARRAPPEER